MRLRPLLIILIAALLSADVAVVATRRVVDPTPSTLSGADPTPTTSVDATPSEQSPTRERQRGERRAAREPEGSSDGPEGTELNLPLLPPEAGTYRYRTESVGTYDGTEQEDDRTDVYRFREATRKGMAMQQLVIIRQGEGETIRRTHRWARDGLTYTRTVSRHGDRSTTCTHRPPELVVPFPARVGRSWEPKEPRCAENPPSQEAEGSHEYSETREILRRETITVAGREIDTLVIREVVDASFEGEAASGRQHSETLKWFSPELRLIVRTRSEVSGETDGGTFGVHTFDITVTSEIQNLEPS